MYEAVVRLEDMRGATRIVNGKVGDNFPGLALAPSVAHRDGEPPAFASYLEAVPLEQEWQTWRSVVDTLAAAAMYSGGAPDGAFAFVGRTAHGTLSIEADPAKRSFVLVLTSVGGSTRPEKFPWPSEKSWTKATGQAARNFSIPLVDSEACGMFHARVRGDDVHIRASLVLAFHDPGAAHTDDWNQLKQDLRRMDVFAESGHGVHSALAKMARMFVANAKISTPEGLQQAARGAYDLEASPCSSVEVQQVAGLVHQGGLGRAIAEHFHVELNKPTRWGRQHVTIGPSGVQSCACGHAGDPDEKPEPLCARAGAPWLPKERRFGPVSVSRVRAC